MLRKSAEVLHHLFWFISHPICLPFQILLWNHDVMTTIGQWLYRVIFGFFCLPIAPLICLVFSSSWVDEVSGDHCHKCLPPENIVSNKCLGNFKYSKFIFKISKLINYKFTINFFMEIPFFLFNFFKNFIIFSVYFHFPVIFLLQY